MRIYTFSFLLSLCLTSFATASVKKSRKVAIKAINLPSNKAMSDSVTGKRKDRSNSLALDNDTETFTDLRSFDFETLSSDATSNAQTPEPVDQIQQIIEIINAKRYGVLPFLELTPATVSQLCALRPYEHITRIEGYTLMHLAAQNDHDEAIMWLVEMGCPTNVYMSRGCTPLQIATINKNLKAARTLLSIPETFPHASSAYGRTSFMSAVYSGHLETVELFLTAPGMNLSLLLNETDTSGLSVLESAHLGHLKVLPNGQIDYPTDRQKMFEKAHDVLIERLLDFADFIKPDISFLVRLFKSDRPRFNRVAIKMPKAAICALKTIDINLIYLAVLEENLELLAALDSAKTFDLLGLAPIHFAAANGKFEVVRFFFKEFGTEILNLQSKSGKTAADYALRHGHNDLVLEIEFIEFVSEIDFEAELTSNVVL